MGKREWSKLVVILVKRGLSGRQRVQNLKHY